MTEQQTTGRPIEVELKYRVIDAAAGERYIDAREIGGFVPVTPLRATQLEDRYVDTADGALAKAGYAARLRQSGGATIVSVKSTSRRASTGSMHRRDELEGPADRTTPPGDWPPSAARSLILEHGGDAPLVELVTIRQLRHKRRLESAGTTVELSLDEVDAVSRSRVVERFVELEIELIEGDEALMATIDAILADDPGLAPSAESKLEAALRAIRGGGQRRPRRTSPPPRGTEPPDRSAGKEKRPAAGRVRATPVRSEAGEAPARPQLTVGKSPGVLADDHIAEAGRKVLRFHLARMIAREAGTRSGTDPEDLHAMRVATRRQRAAWRVFGDAFRRGRTRRHRDRLRDVATRLGAVRDLDVLLGGADSYRASLPPPEQRALEPLLAGWRAHREDARRLLIRELDGEPYRRWLDDYGEFVRHEGLAVAAVAPTTPHRVRDTAPSRILAAYEAVRAYEPVLRWADVETLHDLRIQAKRLRYAIEFVREALGPGSAPLIARVTALQDHLGELNDASVTAHMARSFLVESAGSLSSLEAAAIGRYLASREGEVTRLARTVGVPWRGVASASFRRALGRTLADL